jgi:hypothetical protein
LEQWEDLGRAWRLVSAGLTTSQIKALQADIGTKRRHWAAGDHRTFSTFVRDTIATADWIFPLSAADLDFLTQGGIAGLLEDAIELHMGILKAKAREPEEGG